MITLTHEQLQAVLMGETLQRGGRGMVFRGVTIDSRSLRKGNIFIAIRGARFDGHDFIRDAVSGGAHCLIVEEPPAAGLPGNVCVIRVNDTTRALGALAAAHRRKFSLPVIAVTGSAGKTTTKDLIASVLSRRYRVLKSQGSFNNHWGVPLTLLQLSDRHEAAVVEVGTNHPGEIACLAQLVCPTIAVLTNIGPSHLEGFHTVDEVYREKRCLIDAVAEKGAVVFNKDDIFLKRLQRIRRDRCSFGMAATADIRAEKIVMDSKARLSFRLNGRYPVTLRTPVRENILNALAAAACARLLKVPFSEICPALGSCAFDRNRQQIERAAGVIIIDDSYNANPVSFRSALGTLRDFPAKGRKILVCGDMLELGKNAAALHRETGRLAVLSGVDRILAFGPLMEDFVRAAAHANPAAEVSWHAQRAVLHRCLIKGVRSGDVILVKGSRAMRMETTVLFLKEYFAR